MPAPTPTTIQVWPANENIRRLIKHPSAGGFTGNDGCGNWPPDSFTFRRLADGDVVETKPMATAPAAPAKPAA